MEKKKPLEDATPKRILVLCVDRDGDLEAKAHIKTPLLGRQENLEAAISLALRDPEEPDANAMFEAIRLTDKLLKERKPEEIFEVATISGSERGGVNADRKLAAELDAIINESSATEVILVTDGYSDEAVLPLVQSRVPVSSIRRIVIKHSESIEETAALFGKYFKLLWDNPRYARVVLGIPGILILIGVILAIFNVPSGTILMAAAIILGGIFLFKGFGVDRAIKGFYMWAKEYSPPAIPVQISNYATIAGILCIAVSIYLGYNSAITYTDPLPPDLAGWLSDLALVAGNFIMGMTDLLIVGIVIILLGRSIRWYFERDARMLRNSALVVSVAWSRWILYATAEILIDPNVGYETLVFNIVVGILIGIASVLIIIIIHRSAREFFSKSEATTEEFEPA
jgi:putative membrane protein